MMERLRQFFLNIPGKGDIYLAIAVILIISLIVVPIPLWLLDFFIGINLAVGVVLVMMSLYIPRALAFSSFPSILLFTTLYRLALNITTTRQILLKAEAGQIIDTFGNFVVASNFVVGVVLFLMLLIIQFIVVTKGAERVAEVAARFTLDAMPGKQISIDADLRAGTIDIKQARSRRSEIERESQLYGAMDGAMKFVKGDAIAALIIVAVNIIAGLAIGVLQRDMTAGEAITRYSILTIGDGLVSQIPALLISMSAGIIVTRVGSDERNPLGKDILTQISKEPKSLILGAMFMLLIGFIPGFPFIQFLLMGGGTIALGYVFLKKDHKAAPVSKLSALLPAGKTAQEPDPSAEEATNTNTQEAFSITVPLILELPPELESELASESFNSKLIQVRRGLYHDLGVPFPGIHLRFNKSLANGTYHILLQEVPICTGQYKMGSVLTKETPQQLDILSIPYEQTEAFLPRLPSTWVSSTYMPQMDKAKVGYLDTVDVFSFHTSVILRRYAGEFLGIQETKYLMDQMEATYSEIIREIQRLLPVQKTAEVLQRLVQEDISIRNLKVIFQTLIEWSQKEKEPVLLVEYVRSSLRRYISYKFSSGNNILPAYLLEPEVEEMVRKSIRQTSSGSYLALEPEVAQKLVGSIKSLVDQSAAGTHQPVILASMDVRRYLRKLIELELYDLPVLSHQELTEEITIQPLGRIHLP